MSTENKQALSHTKGPWRVRVPEGLEYSASCPIYITRGELEEGEGLAQVVAQVVRPCSPGDPLANAYVMAAAPEMLELLQAATCRTCKDTGAYYDNRGEVCQCRWCAERDAVLKKALGES
jgi:hypothetical protein